MSVRCSRCNRPRTDRALRLLFAGLLICLSGLTASAQSPSQLSCSDSTRCTVESRLYEFPAEQLFSAAIRALDRLAPASLDIASDRSHLNAVFRVFLFRDDVDVIVEPDGENFRLHIRSMSRTDRWDAGTNPRRVRSFFRYLERYLENSETQR